MLINRRSKIKNLMKNFTIFICAIQPNKPINNFSVKGFNISHINIENKISNILKIII